MEVGFTWDLAKARSNRRKHGISFDQATQVFDDPSHVVREDYRADDEQRYQAIGMSRGMVLLLVIFVDRSRGENVRIRLISARKANDYETYLYQTGAPL